MATSVPGTTMQHASTMSTTSHLGIFARVEDDKDHALSLLLLLLLLVFCACAGPQRARRHAAAAQHSRRVAAACLGARDAAFGMALAVWKRQGSRALVGSFLLLFRDFASLCACLCCTACAWCNQARRILTARLTLPLASVYALTAISRVKPMS